MNKLTNFLKVTIRDLKAIDHIPKVRLYRDELTDTLEFIEGIENKVSDGLCYSSENKYIKYTTEMLMKELVECERNIFEHLVNLRSESEISLPANTLEEVLCKIEYGICPICGETSGFHYTTIGKDTEFESSDLICNFCDNIID